MSKPIPPWAVYQVVNFSGDKLMYAEATEILEQLTEEGEINLPDTEVAVEFWIDPMILDDTIELYLQQI
jgi:hypothetical protein